MLGRSLCALGRYDEAEPLAEQGRDLGHEQDLVTQALWRQVQARVLSHRGQHADAEALAREAVAIIERTDGLNFQGDALCDLAEVLACRGPSRRGCRRAREALDRYERKRNLAMVAPGARAARNATAGVDSEQSDIDRRLSPGLDPFHSEKGVRSVPCCSLVAKSAPKLAT